MADFDAFESEPTDPVPQTTEEDPAAAFLAREQDDLKGLEDNGFEADTGAPQDGEFDPFTGDQMSGSPQQAEGDFFGGAPEVTEDGDMGYGTIPMTADSGLLDFDGGDNLTNGPTDTYSAISQVDRQRQEPEKIRIWREENTRRIEKKDKEEESRKEEWREIAKKELDDWYKHHEEQLTKTKENNRKGDASEEAFVAERDQSEPGDEWEKITRLCEFNPKNSKNTKDISRMRSVLLQLKQTPLVR